MFFRRKSEQQPDLNARLEALRDSGFQVEPRQTGSLVTRGGLGAVVAEGKLTRIGPLVDGEPAPLTDCGFQKFFVTGKGRKLPATAERLHELRAFREELALALGLELRYNEGLGTTTSSHHYDRVTGRA